MVTLLEFYEKLCTTFEEEKENIEIVEFFGMNKTALFRCKKCGTEFSIQPKSLLTRHSKKYCLNCNDACATRKKQINNEEKILQYFQKTPNLHLITTYQKSVNNRRRLAVKYYCDICNEESEIFFHNLTNDFFTCKHCGKNSPINSKELPKWLELNYDGKFSLIDPKDIDNGGTRVLIRCNDCGFIFSPHIQSLRRLNKKVLCPKCRGGKSRGEIYITDFLVKVNEPFISEYNFQWLPDRHMRYDFVLIDRKVILEFDGQQHFEYCKKFGSYEKFELLRKNDNIKNELAIENGYNVLRIPYFLENRIKEILINLLGSTTIPQGSRGKLLEIDDFLNKEEDIV